MSAAGPVPAGVVEALRDPVELEVAAAVLLCRT